jgi:hypothetical protein
MPKQQISEYLKGGKAAWILYLLISTMEELLN